MTPLALPVVLCTETETQGRSKKGQECPFPVCVSKHQKGFWSRALTSALCRREPETALWDIIYFPKAHAAAGGC